jgi:glycosyltransferase involved in cell wall biosynthesis
MIILTTSFNCENFIEKSLLSISQQTFQDFTCYITDDLSTDNTIDKIKKIIDGDNRFQLIQNKTKLFQPGNYDQIIRGKNIPDDEICVEVDGDDWLYNDSILEKIFQIYKEENIWMTSGSFVFQDGRESGQKPPPPTSNLRNSHFNLSHLRTWKSWLWKKINKEDLQDENAQYWNVAGDVSFMFPMYEMSGEEHFKFISEPLYVYNDSNPINDYKVNEGRMWEVDNIIKQKKPYSSL